MKVFTRSFLLSISICLITYLSAHSQVLEKSIFRYDGIAKGNDYARKILTDDNGNVYVTGRSEGSDMDYATIKYGANERQLWVARYNGTGNGYDEAFAIAVDPQGNVYITGWSQGEGSMEDCVTIKYDSQGNEIWVRRFNGNLSANDRGLSISIDQLGNVYVVGFQNGLESENQYILVKYNPDGTLQWIRSYDEPVACSSYARDLYIDNSGNIIITGTMFHELTAGDIFTIKYNSAGEKIWSVKYDGGFGHFDDFSNKINIDHLGNIYVVGDSYKTPDDRDYITLKYTNAGNLLWSARYDGPGNALDYPNLVEIAKDGSVYVAGSSIGINTNYDFCLVKYSPLGEQLWIARYDGPVSEFDCINGMAIDNLGNVYVTGRSFGGWTGTHNDYATIKYKSNGEMQWSIRYNSGPNASDYASNLALDKFGNVFVTGGSNGAGNLEDITTVKYLQTMTSINTNTNTSPAAYSLDQNYPNPFNPNTVIKFAVPSDSYINLTIHDAAGKSIITLIDKILQKGEYNLNWDASGFSSGIYYYTMESKHFKQSKKMLLIK